MAGETINNNTLNNNSDNSKQLTLIKKPYVKFFLIVITLVLIFISILMSFALTYSKIYTGVYIENLNASNYSKEELLKTLNSSYSSQLDSEKILLKLNDNEKFISFKDLNLSYDFKSASDQAYKVGREGNFFQRMFDIVSSVFKSKVISLPLTYDNSKVVSSLESLKFESDKMLQEYKVEFDNDKVTIFSGHPGESIDSIKASEKIKKLLKLGKGGTVELSIKLTEPKKIDVNELVNKIKSEPKDATIKVEALKNYEIVPHVLGRIVSSSDLTSVVDKLNSSFDSSQTITVKTIAPKITTDDLKSKIFKDSLVYKSTPINNSTAERFANLKVGTEFVNGTIVAAGENFSFLKAIGPFTEARGFKDAITYGPTGMVPGIGGGVCQIVSTLHYSVLHTDLKVISRYNHSYPVHYVEPGMDATISEGGPDYVFLNNTGWPVKVTSYVSGNQVHINIMGTKTSNKTYEVWSEKSNIVPASVRYTADKKEPTSAYGDNGLTAYTYKKVFENGTQISSAKLYVSVYKPLDKVVYDPAKASNQSDKPTDKPADKPQDKPTPKPTEKPQDKPTPKPVVTTLPIPTS